MKLILGPKNAEQMGCFVIHRSQALDIINVLSGQLANMANAEPVYSGGASVRGRMEIFRGEDETSEGPLWQIAMIIKDD